MWLQAKTNSATAIVILFFFAGAFIFSDFGIRMIFIESIGRFDLIEICNGTWRAYHRINMVYDFLDFIAFSDFTL